MHNQESVESESILMADFDERDIISLYGEDDKRSISSESTCCNEVKTEFHLRQKQFSSQSTADFEIWRLFQNDDQNMKEIPDADKILNELTSQKVENRKENLKFWLFFFWNPKRSNIDRFFHSYQIVQEFRIDPKDVNNAFLLSILLEREDIVHHLLHNCGANINSRDLKGRYGLHLACLTGNAAIVKQLIIHGAMVNVWDFAKKVTPLHCACSASNVECVEILLNHNANVNAGIEKRSALHIAVEKNSLACIEVLLKFNANPNTPQVYTETPLHTAAALGNFNCMQLLLAHGADVRSQFGKRRMTALHLAAEDNYSECVKLLIEHRANVNVRNIEGKTPLHLACLSQCAETVEVLIANGADVNAAYNDGRTALHAAIVKESKSLDCTKNLLLAGADVNRPDHYGYTPLHIAALNESSACAFLLIGELTKAVRMILKYCSTISFFF